MELRRTFLVAGLVLGLGAGSCATSNELIHGRGTEQTWTLSASPRVPAAAGKVSVLAGKDGNQTIDVRVQRLAEPARVFEGTTTYVVWLFPPDSPPTNIGVLPLNGKLEGSLETKTPFRAFDVEVTAESTPAATRPTASRRVMSASVRLPT
jgi:hypothetical protein